MSDAPTQIVERGFDTIADHYLDWTTRIAGDPKLGYARSLTERLPAGARVLELGCGAGIPCTQVLAERLDVLGVDVSEQQLERARSSVPNAHFLRGDFMQLALAEASFDAVAAFYVLNHIPRDQLHALFAKVRRWLAPGGLFLASLGAGDVDAWTGDWLGTTMFFSSWSAERNRELLQAAGFELLADDLVAVLEPEPDGESTFQWVLAR